MAIIKEYEAGDTARFVVIFRNKDGDVVEPDSDNGEHDVSIEITHLATEEVVVEETQMDEDTNTEFSYEWQTDEDMSLGEYEVEAKGVFGDKDALNRDRVKLVRTSEHR